MLIKAKWLVRYWGIRPNGVVHVGAHLAEESMSYAKLDFGPCLWVEANPRLIPNLLQKFQSTDDLVIQAAIWEESGQSLELNIANNSLSTSLFKFGSHAKRYPSVHMSETIKVHTKRLDEVIPQNFKFNFVNLDIQGAELSALKSLGERISEVDYIFSEVNKSELYKDAPNVSELDSFLQKCGFKREITCWVPFAGWGDALYIRNQVSSSTAFLKVIGTAQTKVFHLKYAYKKIVHYVFRIPRGFIGNLFTPKGER
jgi:FkbM family methyltransferase